MRGMELWRPDWHKVYGGHQRLDAEELATVTRETLRIALSSIEAEMERDYYHNYGTAAREIRTVLALKSAKQESGNV